MQLMSNREYLTRLAWLDEQLKYPDRTDFYIMQLTGYVCHLLDRTSKPWQPSDYKLKIKTNAKAKLTAAQRTAMAKARWNAMANRGTASRLPPRRNKYGQ